MAIGDEKAIDTYFISHFIIVHGIADEQRMGRINLPIFDEVFAALHLAFGAMIVESFHMFEMMVDLEIVELRQYAFTMGRCQDKLSARVILDGL